MPEELSVSVIDTGAGLAACAEEWNRLLETAAQRSICLRWEWLQTWWNVYADCGVKPYVLLLHDAGRLVGIAPFFCQLQKIFWILPVRTLRFLGTGEPEAEEIASEYLDIVAQTGYEARVTQAVWAHLRQAQSWDQLIFNDVLQDSLVLTALPAKAAAEKLVTQIEQVGIRYFIDLPRTWEAYIAMLEPGAAKRIPYKQRKFERAGRVTDKIVDAADQLPQAFAELIRLHTLRWQARGRGGVFASGRFTAFHQALAAKLLPLGMLNIRLLSLDDVNIAVLYNFRYAGTDYFYQGGFDVASAAKHSPGIMAHVYAIADALRAGLQRYDFMKGGVISYKTEFACNESLMHDVLIFSDTLCGRILTCKNKIYRRLRRIKVKWARPAKTGAGSSPPPE